MKLEKSSREISNSYSQAKDSSGKPVDDKNSSFTATNCVSKLLTSPLSQLTVLFTERATKDIEAFHPKCDKHCEYCLEFMDSLPAAKEAISEILQNDPRSVYRKNKCSDKLYFFEIDKLHITCWFDDRIAEVLRVRPVNKCMKSSNQI